MRENERRIYGIMCCKGGRRGEVADDNVFLKFWNYKECVVLLMYLKINRLISFCNHFIWN